MRTQTPLALLQHYWGYETFRPGQLDIINSVLEGNDTLALLPTGGGKSLCFQLPALAKEGICIVISPLLALMQDQVLALHQKNIKAIALPSGIPYHELDTLLDNCIYGNYKFLYLSPERLQQDIVQQRIQQMNVNLIAVDEAHCISQWGHDFRPSYLHIQAIRDLQPTAPCIAVTASATKAVIEDITIQLDFLNPSVYKQSFYRPNLAYHVAHTTDKIDHLLRLLEQYEGSAIVYVRNRRSAVELSSIIAQKHSCTFYHGGVDTQEKKKRFELWRTAQIRIMVATNAFGMGIDKSNVRMVIHYTIPESIESYFQEAGRAGRDGLPANVFLLYTENDFSVVENQFIHTLPSIKLITHIFRKFCNYAQISYGEGSQTKHEFNFNTFCHTYQLNAMQTYNAFTALDRCGVLRLVKRFSKSTKVHVTTSSTQLLGYLRAQKRAEIVVKTILRTYSGIFDDPTPINLSLIAEKTNTPEQELIALLTALQKNDLLTFTHAQNDIEIILLVPREDDRTIHRIRNRIEQQHQAKIQKVEAMIAYVKDNSHCKNVLLLNYFDESNPKDCMECSYCKQKYRTSSLPDTSRGDTITSAIQHLLQHHVSLSSRILVHTLEFPEKDVLLGIQKLTEQGIVKINTNNQYQLVTS